MENEIVKTNEDDFEIVDLYDDDELDSDETAEDEHGLSTGAAIAIGVTTGAGLALVIEKVTRRARRKLMDKIMAYWTRKNEEEDLAAVQRFVDQKKDDPKFVDGGKDEEVETEEEVEN